MWRTVPEAGVDVGRLEFACNRVATAAEGTTSQAPPQGEAAHGTEGAPPELSFAAPQGLIPRREVHRDGGRTILSGIAPGVRIPDMFFFVGGDIVNASSFSQPFMLSFVAIADYRKARLRAMAAEVATSLAPPQGVAATGGAPSEFTETGAEGKIPGVDRVPPTRKMAKSVSFKHAALCIKLAESERRWLKLSPEVRSEMLTISSKMMEMNSVKPSISVMRATLSWCGCEIYLL